MLCPTSNIANRYKLLGIMRDKFLFLKAIVISISTIPKIIPAKNIRKLNPVVGVIFSLKVRFSTFNASRVYIILPEICTTN